MDNRQFLALANALPEALMLLGEADGTVLAANTAAGAFLGAEPEALVGQSIFALVQTPEPVMRKHMRAWARTRQPVPAPIRWKNEAGDSNGWRCHGFLCEPGESQGEGTLLLRCMPGRKSASEFEALNRELNRQRATLRKLQESREREALEHEKAVVTLHSIGDAVITTDRQGCVEYLNPIAETLTGWLQSDATGRSLFDVFHIINENTRDPAEDPVSRCLREGRIVGLANHTALISRDGTEFVIEDSAAPIRNRRGQVLGAVLVFRDVTEDRLIQRQLRYLAQRDTLTGLFNRHYFEQELDRAVQVARRGTLTYAMLYMDLDQFKLVNDTAGHGVGDELLRELGQHFGGRVRQSDVLARLGGDEFGMLLNGVTVEEAEEIADKLLASMEEFNFAQQGVNYEISTSIGIAVIDNQTHSSAEVLRHADIACYVAKHAGRNCRHVFSGKDEDNFAAVGELKLLNEIRSALNEDRFVVHFQSIHPLGDDGTLFYEALVRMVGRDGQLVSPAGVIPTAERYGVMTEIDTWVVRRVLALLQRLEAEGTPTTISVNLSGTSVGDPTLLEVIKRELAERGVPPQRLVFEVTETATIAVASLELAESFMRELRSVGCRFALDDFGTGFSSFTHLKYLPVDYIKIDGTFVRDILSDPVDQAMVRSINQIAQSLNKKTIAEFVENEDILEAVRSFGIDYAQGYFLGEPGPELSV